MALLGQAKDHAFRPADDKMKEDMRLVLWNGHRTCSAGKMRCDWLLPSAGN